MLKFWILPRPRTSARAWLNLLVGTWKVIVPERSAPVSVLAVEPEM